MLESHLLVIVVAVAALLLACCSAAGSDGGPTSDVTEPAVNVTTAESDEPPGSGPDERSPREIAEPIARALIRFANGEQRAIEEVPLADKVALAIHDTVRSVVPAADLVDHESWDVDVEIYAEATGPFNALDVLESQDGADITVGAHPFCAGPPMPAPEGFEGHTRISIQPTEGSIESCMAWYAVGLYYDPTTGTVDAVSLVLFGP